MISRIVAALVLVVGVAGSACRRPATDQAQRLPATQQVVAWRALGSWSGHGNKQTESFTSESGAFRVRWTTAPGTAGARPASATGVFRVTAHSAISGRLLDQVVDFSGSGSGLGYVNQNPNVVYLMVESGDLDWTIAVEEAIAGTVTGR